MTTSSSTRLCLRAVTQTSRAFRPPSNHPASRTSPMMPRTQKCCRPSSAHVPLLTRLRRSMPGAPGHTSVWTSSRHGRTSSQPSGCADRRGWGPTAHTCPTEMNGPTTSGVWTPTTPARAGRKFEARSNKPDMSPRTTIPRRSPEPAQSTWNLPCPADPRMDLVDEVPQFTQRHFPRSIVDRDTHGVCRKCPLVEIIRYRHGRLAGPR